MLRRTLALLIGLLLLTAGLPAVAVPPTGTAVTDDRATSVPTGWRWYTGVTASFLSTTAQQGGYRISDLEVDSGGATFSARLVPNTGSYAAPGGWWWYQGKTLAEVGKLLSTNQARLVDLEGYTTSAGLRYAVVMVRNTGAAARQWYYRVGTDNTKLYNELRTKGFRPQQVGSFKYGSTTYRTLIAVRNTGADARTWVWGVNRTQAQVSALITTNKARLVNLDRSAAGTTYDVLLFKEAVSFWLWYPGLSSDQVTAVTRQTGTRVIDLERYETAAGPRFAVVLLDNLDGPDGKARTALWKRYGSFTQWGMYLKRVSGSTLSSLGATTAYEPASSLKVLVHLHTNLQLQKGQASASQVLPYKKQNRTDWWNSCPDSSTIAGTEKLGEMDRQMMLQSNNPFTHSLRQKFGTAAIEATGRSIGMTATKFNHNIGCSTFRTNPNRTTLTDLGKVYEGVQLGKPLTGAYRTRFLDTMLNQSNSTTEDKFCAVVKEEAASLGKPAAFATDYCKKLKTYTKGGSYGDGQGNYWFSQSGLLVLPVKNGTTRAYVFGDYMQKVAMRSGETSAQLFDPLNAAAREMTRPEIRAALATY